MNEPRTPSRPQAPRSRRARLRRAMVIALGLSLTLASPARALDDIRDRMDDVEQQQDESRADQDAVEEQIDDLGQDLDDTTVELVAADEKLQETDAAVSQAQDDVDAARAELAAAEDEAERIDTELALAHANEEKIQESLDRNRLEQEESKVAVGAIARESYKSGGVGNLAMTLDVLSGDGDAVEDMAMARTVLRVQDNTIERLSTQQAEAVAEQDRLAGVRRDIALLKAQAEANVLRKEEARDEAKTTAKELERLQAQQRKDKAALKAEKASFEGQLAKAQGESDDLEADLAALATEKHGLKIEEEAEKQRIAQQEALRRAEAEERARQEAAAQAERDADAQAAAGRRADQDAESRRRSGSDRLSAPSRPPPKVAPAPKPVPRPAPAAAAPGGYLSPPSSAGTTSEFGYRFHPILKIQRLHAGIDYGGACGSPIRAAANGTVISTPVSAGGGNKIVLDHAVQRGVNLTTTYAHMSGYAVKSGSVKRGQVIGYVGTTGLSTACHLHFETRENGIPVDPRTWL